MKQISEQPPHI